MLKFKIFSRRFFAKLRTQNLAYLSLGFVFILLFLQSSGLVFWQRPFNDDLNQIDIVFRTTLSSIFGFFVSTTLSDTKQSPPPQAGLKESTKESIKENTNLQSNGDAPPSINQGEHYQKKIFNNFRVFILAFVIIFCLITMMIVRNIDAVTASGEYVSSTMMLYRDFISGSIGALIGMARGNN